MGGASLGNGSGGFGSGILISDDVTDTRVGTDGDGVADAAEANVIAYNTSGVVVSRASAIPQLDSR